MGKQITKTRLAVRYAETDKMGIMHHSRYYPWYEVARGDFIKAYGGSYAELETSGVLMPLTESYSKYICGLQYDEEAEVYCKLTELSAARCKFEYEVYRVSDGKLVNCGYTRHGFVDVNLHAVNLKKKNPAAWALMESLVYEE